MRPIIDPQALAARLDEPGLVVVDCRHDLADPEAGARLHAEARIPGARFAHLDRDLSDLGRRGHGRHPLPSAERFCAFLASLGIGPQTRVVAYDADAGQYAARLWWMCRAIGLPEPLLLDGGFAAWVEAGLPLERGTPKTPIPVATWRSEYAEGGHLESDALMPLLAEGRILLLDARARERFRGDIEPIDLVPGHVPGARNRPFTENLQGGRFKAPEQLAAEFAKLLEGAPPDSVVHMCGSGVTACHNLLAMEIAGLPGSRLYVDSWSGWISDPLRPVACGE
ncbi:MAG: sulfurtransferase [Lysobacterales bacterium]|jgi:thiosulfate/3-mercaptopyruvate sulfurtransferase|nr:MAG: sulfurtransferase [Xanthomonadales bacterium]